MPLIKMIAFSPNAMGSPSPDAALSRRAPVRRSCRGRKVAAMRVSQGNGQAPAVLLPPFLQHDLCEARVVSSLCAMTPASTMYISCARIAIGGRPLHGHGGISRSPAFAWHFLGQHTHDVFLPASAEAPPGTEITKGNVGPAARRLDFLR